VVATSITTAPSSFQTLYKDVDVLLPPINLVDFRGNSSRGITFTIDDVSDDFFINPTSGALFVKPTLLPDETTHNYTATMYAVDGGGARALIERIQFTVIEQDITTPANGPSNRDCVNGKRVDTIKFDGHFTCNCNGTAFVDNDHCDEKKTCDDNKSLNIVDGECYPLQINISNSRQRTNSMVYTDPQHESHFAVGRAYQFAPLNMTAITSSTGNDVAVRYVAVPKNVTNSMAGERTTQTPELPVGFFIKPDTGDVLVDFRANDENMIYTISIQVEDDGGARVELERLELSVKYLDVDPNHPGADHMGPGNRPCDNGGQVAEAARANPFDGKYTCSCDAIPFSGDNCQIQTICEITQSFVNGVCSTFALQLDDSTRVKASESAVYTDPNAMKSSTSSYYTVNQTYRIAPFDILNTTVYSSGDRSDVTYTMTGDDEGFFLNPTTGEMQG
jgi:hypothetical protein